MPDTQLIGAKKVSENILAEVRSLALPNQQSSVAKIVTVSIGYTCYHSQEVITPEQLVAITDAELYKAKHSGRNCAIGQQYEVA